MLVLLSRSENDVSSRKQIGTTLTLEKCHLFVLVTIFLLQFLHGCETKCILPLSFSPKTGNCGNSTRLQIKQVGQQIRSENNRSSQRPPTIRRRVFALGIARQTPVRAIAFTTRTARAIRTIRTIRTTRGTRITRAIRATRAPRPTSQRPPTIGRRLFALGIAKQPSVLQQALSSWSSFRQRRHLWSSAKKGD